MDEIQLHVGLKITDEKGSDWRIMALSQTLCILIKMHVDTRVFKSCACTEVLEGLYSGKLIVSPDQELIVIDFDNFSTTMRQDFDVKASFIRDVEETYGPDYIPFVNHEKKTEYIAILNKYGFSQMLGNRILTRWWQSGLQDGAWVDRRALRSKDKQMKAYSTKTGRKSPETQGVILNNELIEQFEYGIDLYKHNRKVTKRDAFAGVLARFYTRLSDDRKALVYLPEDQRPTYRQFEYYFSKKISSIEQKMIKTSRDEFYNDNRLLFGFNRTAAVKPGYILEADALEMDIYIVSTFNQQQTISRPIIYMLTDLYSHAIVAFHVGFDNNSMLGLSSLMMNLFDDKQMILKRHGITDVDTRFWPSCFIPHEIRCDRGSDFASDKFEKICQDLGIVRTLEHGATGSMKGLIEQSFRQFHQATLPFLEHQGVMLKRYDSNHKKEACLTIEDIYQLIVMFIIKHNRQYVKSFSLTKEMREAGVSKDSVSIWEYGVKHNGLQRPITPVNYQSCLFHVLPEGKAMLSREGVKFNGLLYKCNPEDRELIHAVMMSQINGGKKDRNGNALNSFMIRFDPRSIDEVYYFKDQHVEQLHLDSNKNNGLRNITWDEYGDYRKVQAKLDKDGINRNLEDRVKSIVLIREISANAVTPTYAESKQINEFRKLEKNETNYNNRVSTRFEDSKEELPEAEKNIAVEGKKATEPQEAPEKPTETIDSEFTLKPYVQIASDSEDGVEDEKCPDELCDFL